LRYRLTLQDLSEMFLERGIIFSHETSANGKRNSHLS
jgi:transposase-like protein